MRCPLGQQSPDFTVHTPSDIASSPVLSGGPGAASSRCLDGSAGLGGIVHHGGMAGDILDRAAAAIDGNVMFEADGRPFGLGLPTDGLGGSHELGDGVTMIESYAHVHVVETDSAAVVFDSSVPDLGPRVAERVRAETRAPVSHLVLTHGHRDHAGGAAALIDGLAGAGHRPLLVGHEALPDRMARYRLTDGYNQFVNQRQFGRVPNWDLAEGWAFDVPPLDVSFRDGVTLDAGGLEIELRHVRAETDDHLWAWIAERRGGGDRRPDAVALPQRGQPGQDPALPAGVGRRAARPSPTPALSCCCRATGCPSAGPNGFGLCCWTPRPCSRS